MRQAKPVIIQDIPDELRNRKAKTSPKVLNIKSHLAWRWVVNPTLGPKGEQPKLLQDTVLFPEPIDIRSQK